MYYRGEGVPQDYQLAAHWWRRAAEQGSPDAQVKLGLLYLNGEGVERDQTLALHWMEKAANQGFVEAQVGLALLYNEGAEGVPTDATKAVPWFLKAAERGHLQSRYSLGYAYSQGRGVAQDFIEAHKWFNLAAAANIPDAVKARDIVANMMTREQIAEAQRLAREWSQVHR